MQATERQKPVEGSEERTENTSRSPSPSSSPKLKTQNKHTDRVGLRDLDQTQKTDDDLPNTTTYTGDLHKEAKTHTKSGKIRDRWMQHIATDK